MMRGTFLCCFPNATGAKFGKMGSSFYIAKRERGLVKLGELEKLDASDISDKSDRVRQVGRGQTDSDGSDMVRRVRKGYFLEGMSLQ